MLRMRPSRPADRVKSSTLSGEGTRTGVERLLDAADRTDEVVLLPELALTIIGASAIDGRAAFCASGEAAGEMYERTNEPRPPRLMRDGLLLTLLETGGGAMREAGETLRIAGSGVLTARASCNGRGPGDVAGGSTNVGADMRLL